MNPLVCNNDIIQQKKNNNRTKISSNSVFGTYEWAASNANFINGCKHNCKYCYSKAMAIRFRRKTPRDWKTEEIRKDSLRKKINKNEGTIMFPSSHDIHPDHLEYSLKFLKNLLKSGNKVLIVTKPHLECIEAICGKFEKYKDNILFRFTIGSSNSNTLRFWEPGAPDFEERIASLEWAYNKGFNTSISCEPMLDDDINDVIEQTVQYVTDAIWIGKANYLLSRLKINGADDMDTIEMANKLIECQSDDYIVDLYNKFRNNTQIKWKESVKKIVGIKISSQKGLDV